MALLMAIAMVGLCVVAAMVIDLGLLRVDRQRDKSAEDAASIAGVNGLISDPNSPILHPFAGVCQAIKYLKVNTADLSTLDPTTGWTNGSGGAIAGNQNGCDTSHANDVCTPSSPATWARWVGTTSDGVSRVTIQSGYKPVETNAATDGNVSTVTGGAFPDESLSAYSSDQGAAEFGGCDQLAVILNEGRNTTLGSPARKTMGTRVRSVARVNIIPPTTPYALLVLNRTDCLALANTSNGTIDVSGIGINPGLIHVDSDSTGAQCNSKPVIQGAKADGVFAHDAPTGGALAEITVVAKTNTSDGLTNVHAGTAPKRAPVPSALVTRSVLDSVYRSGVQAAVTAASPLVTASSAPVGWTSKPCPSGPATYNDSGNLFIDCSGGGGNLNKDLSLPNASGVIIAGSVAADLSMPKATRVYIRGSTPNAVTVSSVFEMNNGTAGTGCPTTFDTSKTRAQLFVGTGAIKDNGGTFRACNTTVILMGGDTTSACVPTTSPTYFPVGNICPTTTRTSAGTGTLDLGGNSIIDWTAPDISDDSAPASTLDHSNLEDLALWTETSGTHTLGGGGSMHLLGVFAAPNGDLKLNGGPVSNVANSQYIARTLNTTGNGTLLLTPQPSLPVAPPKINYFLVR